MELTTHSIYTNHLNCKSDIQITLEDDMNVPDTKPDIETIIKTQGSILINDIVPSEDRVLIKGALIFSMLYQTNEDIRPIHNLKGQIPFEENINMDNLSTSDNISCHYELEDCQANLINSRKISISSIVSLHCCQMIQSQNLIGTDIVAEDAARADMDNIAAPEGLHKKFRDISFTQLALHKKDIFRINDEVSIPKGKPSIDTVLYYEMNPQNLQTKIIEDGIRIIGDVHLFLLYIPDDEERRLEYLESEIPFDGIVNCSGCNENFIPDIEITTGTFQLEPKPDDDGEIRLMDLELLLKLEMRFYEDNRLSILDDAYSTACDLKLTRENVLSEKLLVKNQSTLRVSDTVKISDNDDVLQLCSSNGRIQIDEQTIIENGIQIEGVIELDILYITENDNKPLNLAKGVIPFSHVIEIKGISPDDSYELQTDINQINVIMTDGREAEAKVSLSVCAIVFTNQNTSVISSITESPLDLKRLHDMPGMVGFIAEKDGNLWDIAKEYSTTIESIMELNNLKNDNVKKGDKLLLLKMVDGL